MANTLMWPCEGSLHDLVKLLTVHLELQDTRLYSNLQEAQLLLRGRAPAAQYTGG